MLLKLRDHKDKLTNKNFLEDLERQIISTLHNVQLEGYLDAAKRADFKGQKKKALDQYYEALYFLKHDEIEDSLQMEHISTIEAKIEELTRATKSPDGH